MFFCSFFEQILHTISGRETVLKNGGDVTVMLETVITTELCTGVMTELVSVIPKAFPAIIGCIAVRKAIGWVVGMLKAA